jgi:PAP2 superfamily
MKKRRFVNKRLLKQFICIKIKLFYVALFLIAGCQTKPKKYDEIKSSYEVATKWADMALFITKNTFANTPTYSSRALGYLGLTMYETVVNKGKNYQSLAGQLNGLTTLPLPVNNKQYNWELSLNAGQAFMLKKIYNQTADENKLIIDSLEKVIYNQFAEEENNKEVVQRSVSYGKAVAEAIYKWSETDGGNRGYLHNFDPKFTVPDKPGCWKPAFFSQVVGHLPLHPYWGKNRTFLKTDAEIALPQFVSYSTSPASKYAALINDVYQKNITLTQEEKEIALWWNDDPSDSYTPPGHSYNLGTIIIKNTKPDLVKCAETYAKIGIAVADAFINCWKWKYTYMSERPSTYINDVLNKSWESFWPNPPFPAFPSGHAIQASAAATVMANIYGEHFSFTDNTHVGKPRDENKNVDYKPRSFTSFWQVAEETANSRFFGGIHTRFDNETGLQEGKKIGNNINKLKWLKG